MVGKKLAWSEIKNEHLKRERGLCFEDIAAAVEQGRIIDDYAHPNALKYPNQRILAVEIDGYVCLAPYVRDGEVCFLKTVYQSRKAPRLYQDEI